VKTYGTFKVLTLIERTRAVTREPTTPALELFSWRGAPTVMFTQISIERMINFCTLIPANSCRKIDWSYPLFKRFRKFTRKHSSVNNAIDKSTINRPNSSVEEYVHFSRY